MRHLLAAAAAPVVGSCQWDRLLRPQFSGSAASHATIVGACDLHAASNIGNRGRTANLVKAVLNADPSARAFMVGDLTHTGTTLEHEQYYHNTWGAFRDRTLFQMGNHDNRYADPPGAAYYAYTGAPIYYAVTLGSWRLYMMNPDPATLGGADTSEQTAWLRDDLGRHPDFHYLAMFHYPMFSSVCDFHLKTMTQPTRVGPWWQVLQEHGAEFAVSGHAHRWERFRRKLRDGTVSANGIRQFVVGTAGVRLRGIVEQDPDSEKVVVAHGVVRFDLHPDRYEWTFTDVSGVVRDSGTQICRKVLV
jgi:hypothetical protein